MNSCHFHDTILIDYAVMDTGNSRVPNEEFQFTSCIRDFHVYESAWTPTHHEILHCSREEGNVHDLYVIKVIKSGIVVGHLPKKISETCFLLLRKGVRFRAKLQMRGNSVQLIWCREGLKYSACWFLAVRREIYWTSCRNYWLLALKK